MNIKIPKFFILFLSVAFFVGAIPLAIKGAGEASLYLSPASGTFFVGSTFEVSVFVNTGGENINAVEVNLKFDPKQIQVASPTAGKSFIEVWVAQPSYSNTLGEISFIGGTPTPGIKTSAGLVSTVTFRVISPGETSVYFLKSSKVLRNDPQGTNILTSTGRGVYTLLLPPPEGPKIYSLTHPDQNKWYKNNNPTFYWEKEEGVTDFSYSFDQDLTVNPDNSSEGSHTSVSFSNVGDGMWYFHVKAKKEGVWGGTSTYLVRIDSTSPAAFTPTVEPTLRTTEKQPAAFAPTVEPGLRTTEKQPLVFFMTTDALSGMDYYQLKYIDITAEREEEKVGFFQEVTSPYRLPPLEPGKYLVIVRAHDVAGNFREGTVEVQIFRKGIYFTKQGIRFLETIIPWWIIILIILIIVLLIFLILIQRWKRQRALLKERKTEFEGIRERLENQRQKIIDKTEYGQPT